MEYFMGKQIINSCKPINVIVWYVTIACYMQIFMVRGEYTDKIPALLVFGDSIVDSGNNNYIDTIIRSNFPPYGRDFYGGVATGRFSNGKIPTDLIVEAMGIKDLIPPYLDPTLQIDDLVTGVSFAFGSSGYDPESAKSVVSYILSSTDNILANKSVNVKTMDEQLTLFKEYINKLKVGVGENMTSTIISHSVYLVSAGSNDISNTYFGSSLRRSHDNTSSYSNMMVTWASAFVQELYGLGARKIVVASAPPSGCMPSQRTLHGGPFKHCAEEENNFSVMYNLKLKSELSSLNQKLAGSTIVYLDIFNPVMDIINDAAKSGSPIVDRGCCGTGNLEVSFLCTEIGTCRDSSKFIFWDSFHPTEATYRILVDDLLQKHPSIFSKITEPVY